MLFLLTNDDGFDAPGMSALIAAAAQLGDVVVAAPAQPHSGCSHKATTQGPIAVDELAEDRFRIHGSPVDTVRLGLTQLAPQADIVLAGLNDGANLGMDVFHSGTVAAAREAAILRRPAFALSHYRKNGCEIEWDKTPEIMTSLLQQLLPLPLDPGSIWNVNLPAAPTAAASQPVFCPLDRNPLPLDYRREADGYHYAGSYSQRERTPDHDVDVCFSGRCAVTRLPL